MRTRAIVAAVAVAAASFACADLFGFHDLREGDASVEGGSPDGAPDVSTCTPATWPASPTQEKTGDAGSHDFVVAMRHVYFSSAPDGGSATFGYDLDGKCTLDGGSASCVAPRLITDQPNGVDDESISLMNTLVGSFQPITTLLDDSHINDAIATGYFTIVLRLINYNGGTDQPSNKGLQLAIQASPGVSGTANFDGTDVWKVSTDDSLSPSTTYAS
jgi:hypothetical protein